MKKILFAFVFTLFSSLFVMNLTSYAAEKGLSSEEIAKELNEISSSYSVGEKLSSEDAKFIKKHGKTANPSEESNNKSITTLAPQETFYGSGSAPNGDESAAILGTYSLNQGYINQSYAISMTTAMDSGTAEKITNEHTHTAYGALGTGGIFKVYDKNDERSCDNQQSCYSYFSEQYSAHVVYYTQVVKSTIYHDGYRSFDITVNSL